MIGDALCMLWISVAAVLLALLIRAAFLWVKRGIRQRERERLEREGRIIFHEKIDDFFLWDELERNFREVTSLASVFSLIIVIGLPLIDFLQNLVDALKGLMG